MKSVRFWGLVLIVSVFLMVAVLAVQKYFFEDGMESVSVLSIDKKNVSKSVNVKEIKKVKKSLGSKVSKNLKKSRKLKNVKSLKSLKNGKDLKDAKSSENNKGFKDYQKADVLIEEPKKGLIKEPEKDSYVPESGFSFSDKQNSEVFWFDSGQGYTPIGNPPACPEPLLMQPPVDFNLASGVLYPGQYRGNNYKAHGGFRFDGNNSNAVSVKIPFDAYLIDGSRYIEFGNVQYMFTFIAPCGIMYRFDHLLTLTAEFQKVAEYLPQPKVDDTRTTKINPHVAVTAGQEIATAVGESANVFLDFGVYDLRKSNEVSGNPEWVSKHQSDPGYRMAAHGICWFDLFPEYKQVILNLPGADSGSGKSSDYCK